jgi:hypothetical protein
MIDANFLLGSEKPANVSLEALDFLSMIGGGEGAYHRADWAG